MTDTASQFEKLPENPVEKAEKAAAIYAWEYFKYHAAQRQAVFRFYLTLIGATTIVFAYSLRPAEQGRGGNPEQIHLAVGILFMLVSFLFWRLDKRSRHLIKLSETALKVRERKLKEILSDPSIELMKLGDELSEAFPLSEIETFRRIYSAIFIAVGIVGAFIVNWKFGILVAITTVVWYLKYLYSRYRRGKLRWR